MRRSRALHGAGAVRGVRRDSAALVDDKLRAALAEELQSKMEAIPPRDPEKLSSKVAQAATFIAIQRLHSGELSRQAFPVHLGLYKALVERSVG